MSSIVCAVRGGPESENTIKTALSLAREKGLPLHFLYVVNLDFLSNVTGGHVQTVSKEMRELGKFILEMAVTQAEEVGVQAISHIRQGKVHLQLINLCQELRTGYVVLGKTRQRGEGLRQPRRFVRTYGETIKAETGAEVVVASEGDEA
ncbi:universal stress protein [candidate division CSSED10-310 bacterium]|uniref:Universal stress protein n=1 Tax=candidate division CSSED10-310 bacterium TaxID=2855610 RepID=A0ABV6Z4N0_UNCC1